MVGTSNLGSWISHWFMERYPPKGATRATTCNACWIFGGIRWTYRTWGSERVEGYTFMPMNHGGRWQVDNLEITSEPAQLIFILMLCEWGALDSRFCLDLQSPGKNTTLQIKPAKGWKLQFQKITNKKKNNQPKKSLPTKNKVRERKKLFSNLPKELNELGGQVINAT